MKLPGATAENAHNYMMAAVCGAVLVIAVFGLWYGSRDLTLWLIIPIAAGMLACMFAGLALAIGLYRRSRAIRQAGASLDPMIAAGKRLKAINVIGIAFYVAAFALEYRKNFTTHEFPGESLVVMLCILGGLLMQFYSQVKYLQALG